MLKKKPVKQKMSTHKGRSYSSKSYNNYKYLCAISWAPNFLKQTLKGMKS